MKPTLLALFAWSGTAFVLPKAGVSVRAARTPVSGATHLSPGHKPQRAPDPPPPLRPADVFDFARGFAIGCLVALILSGEIGIGAVVITQNNNQRKSIAALSTKIDAMGTKIAEIDKKLDTNVVVTDRVVQFFP